MAKLGLERGGPFSAGGADRVVASLSLLWLNGRLSPVVALETYQDGIDLQDAATLEQNHADLCAGAMGALQGAFDAYYPEAAPRGALIVSYAAAPGPTPQERHATPFDISAGDCAADPRPLHDTVLADPTGNGALMFRFPEGEAVPFKGEVKFPAPTPGSDVPQGVPTYNFDFDAMATMPNLEARMMDLCRFYEIRTRYTRTVPRFGVMLSREATSAEEGGFGVTLFDLSGDVCRPEG